MSERLRSHANRSESVNEVNLDSNFNTISRITDLPTLDNRAHLPRKLTLCRVQPTLWVPPPGQTRAEPLSTRQGGGAHHRIHHIAGRVRHATTRWGYYSINPQLLTHLNNHIYITQQLVRTPSRRGPMQLLHNCNGQNHGQRLPPSECVLLLCGVQKQFIKENLITGLWKLKSRSSVSRMVPNFCTNQPGSGGLTFTPWTYQAWNTAPRLGQNLWNSAPGACKLVTLFATLASCYRKHVWW